MLNELYQLSEAMKEADVRVQSWHSEYKPIPNAPRCIRILISEGHVLGLSEVKKELGATLRKFGNNQGTYPCMNLAPLYRIPNSEMIALSACKPEELDEAKLAEIRALCQKNNWGKKFRAKYRLSMKDAQEKLAQLVPEYTPLRILMEESSAFWDPDVLYRELEEAAFQMLRDKENTSLALRVLFYQEKSENEDKYGTLSVALDSPRLIALGVPAVSQRFTSELNAALLAADAQKRKDEEACSVDAFGIPFDPAKESEPMPCVKLAGGFEAALRTMFKGQPCQERYNRFEDKTYPLSWPMRTRMKDALEWLGAAERRDMTWMKTDDKEILFAYPARLPEAPVSFTRLFRLPENPENADITFPEQAEQFLSELRRTRVAGTDSNAERIQIFILRNLGAKSTRTKVVYTRQTDPHELEKCSERWTCGCSNLPLFPFGQPRVLFPLEVADILNYYWKQNGEAVTNAFKPVPQYHGIELLMEPDLPVTSDLHSLAEKTIRIGTFCGNELAREARFRPKWDNEIKNMLALMGLLLHREGIGKETYMENLPYLYGQLLKVSDTLHALYCMVVREGTLPTQLAGSAVYQAAAEAPIRTLNLLGQRMNPYIAWAKTYRTRGISEKGKESWRAAWLLSLYESIATKLYMAWRPETRLNDEEKALLFIGYLAAFPQREQGSEKTERTDQMKEEQDYE